MLKFQNYFNFKNISKKDLQKYIQKISHPDPGVGPARSRSWPEVDQVHREDLAHLKTNVDPRHYRDPCQYYDESFLGRLRNGKRRLTL